MWHEARRREKATQKILNDHKKRAEKRREENRVDPNSLLLVHGLKSKLHLDSNVYKQAAKSLVSWQGDKNVTIDRFDVRATLSSIPPENETDTNNHASKSSASRRTVLDCEESEPMKRLLNFERYRLLIQNDLNRVPDELRLKLVANSDTISDAKMRKLRNNRFGTSGETPMNHQRINNKPAQHDQAKRGLTIGFNYSSVPPPSSMSTRDKNLELPDHRASDSDKLLPDNSASKIVDLDEFDNFELDGISIANIDTIRVNDISRKYGMTHDEFRLIVERESRDAATKEILKELSKLVKRNQSLSKDQLGQKQQVYGPVLPPELAGISSYGNQESGLSTHSDSSSDGSPIGQRSPSGADIPLRHKSESDLEASPPDSVPVTRVSTTDEVRGTIAETTTAEGRKSSLKPQACLSPLKCTPSDSNRAVPGNSRESQLPDNDNSSKDNSITNSSKRYRETPRRASTPLAYKRNCRSSRSLSRERRSSRTHSSTTRQTHRSRRYRSSSRSGSESSTSSSSSNSSGKLSRRRKTSRRYERPHNSRR